MEIAICLMIVVNLILLYVIYMLTKELECYMRICEKQGRELFVLEKKLAEMVVE